MASTAAEERKVIAQLFNDEQMQVALDKILAGKRLEDKAYEQVVARAFVDRAKVGFGGASLFTLSDSDMHTRAAALMGVNDMGKSIVDDPDFIKRNLPEFLNLAKDGGDNAPLMNAELCRAMVRYVNDPEDMRMPEPAKEAFESVLTDQFKTSLVQKMREGAFKSPLSEEDTESLYHKLGVAPEPVNMPNEAPEPEGGLDNAAAQPENEAQPDPDAPQRGNATLSTDALLQQVGALEEQADLEARKHRLHIDAQTEAQMAINKLMDENPSWVRRTTIHKLKDKITNGTNSLLGQDPLVYPSESLFGDTLAVMDVNGRVEQTLLHYRSGPGLERRVEFKSPNVPEEAYMLAALQVKRDGIRKPHVSSNFRDPKKAIDFMQRSVDALVEAGYHIDDISVDRHLQQAFENYKLEKHGPAFSIGERPESEPEPEPELKREVMPEEVIDAQNEQINSPTISVADQLADLEKGMGFDDIQNEDILPVMPLLAELNNPEKTWQQVQDESGLSPTARGVVERLKVHVDSIVAKLDPESDVQSKYGPKAKDIKLLAQSVNLLEPLYGREVMARVMPVLQEKADEVLKREAEKAEKLANANDGGAAPQHNGQSAEQPQAPVNEQPNQDFGNQSPDGYDPELNGAIPPTHMFDGPPIEQQGDSPESMGYDDYSDRDYGDQDVDVYVPPEFQNNVQAPGIDDMAAPQESMTEQPPEAPTADVPVHSNSDEQAPGLDEMAAGPEQDSPVNLDGMSADAPSEPAMTQPEEPAMALDDMAASPQAEENSAPLDEMAASNDQSLPEEPAQSVSDAPSPESPAPGVPASWMQKLEEIGWEELTPEQVTKIPKPDDFTEEQKKTPAYRIASIVDALINMDEFMVDSATPTERAFLDRMPADMLMENVKEKLEASKPVSNEVKPEQDQSDEFTRRKR